MAEKSDVIILDNGDKMTGEIRKLERGRLEFKPDRIQIIQIEWARVDFLYSPDQFDLELESGVRIFTGTGHANCLILNKLRQKIP